MGISLTSPNGKFRLVQQGDGNLVVYQADKPLWSTATHGSGAATMLQTDGNLVTYIAGKAVWASNTAGRTATALVMQDDGNLVLYDGAHKAVWAANSRPDRLLVGEKLGINERLWSRNGQYNLVQQGDGNLVVYQADKPLWSTATHGSGAATMLQTDGNLVTYIAGKAVWASNTAGRTATALVMQDDGNLVLYDRSGAPLWASRGLIRGDDYPSSLRSAAQDSLVDPWRFYNRECTSFVAWRLNNANGIAFSNFMTGPNGRAGQFGNATNWAANARAIGYRVDSTPAVGSVAWFAGGHVAWVAQVNGDGTVLIEEYNYGYNGSYNKRTVKTSAASGFIHLKDL